MIQDVYEPLSRYRDEFKAEFAWRTEEKFQELTRASGIDVEANRRLIEEIRVLVDHSEEARGKRSFFGCLFVLLIAGSVVAFIAAYNNEVGNPIVLVALGIIGIIASLFLLSPHKKASQLYKELKKTIEAKKDVAWKQMEPLNALYTWDIPVKLIQATVPRLEFDPYFTNERLWSLQRQYGWNDDFNRDKSILFAQSGLINGNPFVFGEYRYMKWENHVYKGTKDISWTEQERDSNGNYRTVTHHETLEATVTKPEPVYKSKKLLIYGNDAAPNLSFSRQPSDLSKGDEGLFTRLRKKHEIRKLQKFSQNLEDESQFTLMGNHDFEALFHAVDRDNEVEFRLLFTSLAQIQMLDLLKDKSVGYGDDFTFRKKKKINLLTSNHLDATSIDTDPKRFHDWDYDRAKANFQGLNEEYFKNIYFSLAPLLAIPLYQQTRTHEEIWKDVLRGRESSFWEHETLANYYGYGQFKHPDCVTKCILKTSLLKRQNEEGAVEVTAYGYRGVDHTEYVEVRGGDGAWYDVPVKWIEYLPVENSRVMYLTEQEKPSHTFRAKAGSGSILRRSITSCLGEYEG